MKRKLGRPFTFVCPWADADAGRVARTNRAVSTQIILRGMARSLMQIELTLSNYPSGRELSIQPRHTRKDSQTMEAPDARENIHRGPAGARSSLLRCTPPVKPFRR